MVDGNGKILEGVFAINKPLGISSAQVLRDLQQHFDPSEIFAPWIAREKSNRGQQSNSERKRRRNRELHVKIGHGGTLDPLATGVLVTGVGKGTKLLPNFLGCTKEYEAIVLFGASTDTYDRGGKILKRAPYQHITRELVEQALNQFRGNIMQLPPLYSALKMDGKALYEYAREGKAIPRQIEKRAVEVEKLEIVEWMEGGTHEYVFPREDAEEVEKELAKKFWEVERAPEIWNNEVPEQSPVVKKRKTEEIDNDLVPEQPALKRKAPSLVSQPVMSGALQPPQISKQESEEFTARSISKESHGPPAAKLRMTVTSGFYVRSLCHDLGEAVSSQAIMAGLIRTRQGQFQLGSNVLDYSELAEGEEVWGPKVRTMLEDWAREK